MSKVVNRDSVISDLKDCIKQLDKIIDDVMELESAELYEPIEKLVLRADELVSYDIFRSTMDLKNAIVKLVGGSNNE